MQYEVELAIIAARPIYNIGYAKKMLTAEAYESLWKRSILGYAIGKFTIILLEIDFARNRPDWKKFTR